MVPHQVLDRYLWSRSPKYNRSFLSIHTWFRLLKGSTLVSSIDLAAMCVARVART